MVTNSTATPSAQYYSISQLKSGPFYISPKIKLYNTPSINYINFNKYSFEKISSKLKSFFDLILSLVDASPNDNNNNITSLINATSIHPSDYFKYILIGDEVDLISNKERYYTYTRPFVLIQRYS